MIGIVSLVVVVVLVVAVAVLRTRLDGRLRSTTPGESEFGPKPAEHGDPSGVVAPPLSEHGIALPPDRITVVQFTAEFCASCQHARTLVERVLRDHRGIGHLEVDVADHIPAVRALDIRRTPTLVMFDGHGRAIYRASGIPREGELRKALSSLAAQP